MVTKEYQNFKYQQPYQQAMYYCSLILQDQTWPWIEQLEVLPNLQAEDLAKFVPAMLSRTFFECYIAGSWAFLSSLPPPPGWLMSYFYLIWSDIFCTGNIESDEAESMTKHIEDVLFKCSKPLCQPLFPSQHLTNRVVKLESGINHFYPSECLNPDDENSALVHYIQVNLVV